MLVLESNTIFQIKYYRVTRRSPIIIGIVPRALYYLT